MPEFTALFEIAALVYFGLMRQISVTDSAIAHNVANCRTYSRLPNNRLILRLIYVRNCFIQPFSRIKRFISGLDDFFA